MNDTIKILYNYKYGAFIIPYEILRYLEIDHNNDKCFIEFSDPIRRNNRLIKFIEQFKNHKKYNTHYTFLSKILTDIQKINQIYGHLEKIDIKEVPCKAYEYDAIIYTEYDGKERIEINYDKLKLMEVKSLLEKLCTIHISEELNKEIYDILNTIP